MRAFVIPAVLVALAGALLAGAALRADAHETPFLRSALGSRLEAAPDRRTPAGTRVQLARSGYRLETGSRLGFHLASAESAGGEWRHHERGAVRSTPFGAETIVVDGEVVEQFLTVSKRTGRKTWRWKLDTGTLKPHLRPDGSVLVSTGNIVGGFQIAPAAILDRQGRDVSPTGTTWDVERRDGSWWLTLALDDRDLPLPYVIDPATIALRQSSPANNGGGATTLTITKPTGLAVDDQMIAQVTVRNGTSTFICPPPGWTSVDRRNSTTTLAQEVFRKTATAGDVAAATFAFTLDNTAGCGSPLARKASGGIVAFFGVDNSAPISAVNGQANASSVNIAAPTISPAASDVILGVFGTAIGTTVTAPTGAPAFTERWDTASTGSASGSRTTSELATALAAGGATGTKTAVAAAAAVNIGQLVALRLDTTAPTAPTLSVTESDADTFVSGTTLYYRPAGNGGSFTVDATTTETGSGVQHIAFPGLTGGFTPITTTNDTSSPYSQAYSWAAGATDSGAKTVTAQDNATNTASSSFTLTSDSAAPATAVTTAEGANAGLQHFVNTGANAYTLFYNPSATGDFTFTSSATDGGSGMAQVAFPSISATGFSGSAVNDTGTPFVSNTYSFTTANAVAPGNASIVATDNVGNATTDTITFNRDATVPTGGALSVNGTAASGGGTQSYDGDGAFAIGLRTDYTDTASGIASSTLTREDGTLSGDACSSYGAPTTLVGTPAQSGLATGCYRYVLTGTDNVGNAASVTTVVKVDTSAPGAPGLTVSDSSADVYTTGTSVYYRPAGAGSFDVTASATDAHSGILDYGFPALAGFTGSGSGATRSYTLATPTEVDGSKPVTARNPALLSSAASTFTLTADSAFPTGGALTVNGVTATGGGSTSTSAGSFAITRTDYTDTGSGIAASTLTRDSAPFTNDGCGTYSGSPTTIVGTPAQSLASGCYEYVLTGTDAVGNTTSIRTVVQVHGAATQVVLTGSTANLTSGSTRVLTATVRDAAGNTVASDSSTLVAFTQASGAGSVSGTGNTTVVNGVATKTITGTLAGPVTMEATSAGLTTGTLGAFTVVHGAATRITLTHSGSNASGDNHTLTATILDAAGNVATSDSTTVVAFAKTGGAGTVTGLGNVTASGGVATNVVVNAGSGQIDLDAQVSGLATGTASYTITAGSASTLTSTITASPTSIVADGSSTSAITVRLKDAAGNDLVGSGGTVALALTGSGSLSAVTDNGDGTYSATLTSPTAAGSATVTGTLNAAALAATAGVTYTHGPATRITLTESGSNVAANVHTLTATITDANGNTVTSDNSTVVTFAKTGGAGTVTGLGAATASGGVATRSVTNRLAGQIDLDAQASGLATGTASYTITAGPVSPAATDSTVVAAPTNVYANGSDSATITVTLRDAGGNGIPGKTVTLAQGAGGSTISGGGSTNASGVVTFTVANASVETITYTATDTTDSITLTDDATVDFTFADSTPPTNTVTLGSATRALLTGATLYYNGAAGGSFTLSSAVADSGSGPASATYPAVAQPGWTHGAETVSTPAGGPYVSSAFTFAAGANGDFTHAVTASDAWAPANTNVTTLNVTEDSTAPAASILCGGAACPAGWYTSTPVSVTLTAPDAGAGLDQLRYTTDGTDPTVLTGNVYAGPFNVTAEGVTTVKYRAFDRVGNDTGVQTQVIRIDTVAPSTTIDSAPAAATQDTTPTFAFSSPEAGSTFQVRLDGGAWTTGTSPLTLGPLAESTYAFEVRATDVAGNVDASPASFTFTVDTTPADTTITSSPAAASGSTSASFSFTASDAGPGFECRLDGGAFADCSSPQSYTGLTEAAHTFEVRAEDAAGNLDTTPAAHAWTVDLTAPSTSYLSTPANPSANSTPTFGLGSTEPGSTFECDLDDGGWSPCATPFTTPALSNGTHTLKTRATDAAGNTDASEVTYTWLVDATAPTGSITSPANGADLGGTIVLASDSADTGGSGVAAVVFQRSPASVGAWTNQAASWDTTAQADGDYDLRVVTTDGAGNAFTSGVITITVDNTAPSVSVVAPNPVNLATADPATVGATATDAGSGIANVRFDQCAEDSPACVSDSWVLLGVDTGAPYQASWPVPSDGPRLLRARATDNAGKQTTELVLITIDRIRPVGSLTAPSAGANLRGAAVALAATASDTAPGSVNTVTFQRSPAGAGTWTDILIDSAAPYASSLDTTGLADGLYDLRVFTTDAAGNAEAAPATTQVRVDNTLPTGAITAPAPSANVRGTIALTSNSADSGSGVDTVVFERSPAGAGTWTAQAASFDTTSVGDGQYDLRVVTTDNAGNTFTSAPITIRVDNTLPTGSITAPAPSANVRGTIALTSNSADSGSGVDTVVFERSPAGAGTWTAQAASFDTTSVGDGQYDLRVVTTDNAGNTFTSAPITIRVDNTLPTGSVTAPANGAEIGVPPVALTSSSADAGSGVATVVFERSPAGAGTWTATAAGWNTASGPDAVADGSYDLRVKTTDNAGNVFTSPTTTVLVDHTAPTTSASLAPGTPSNAPVTVSFSASDGTGSGVSVISYRVDGGSLQTGAAVVVPAPGDRSNDGAHLVEFFSTDDVGNVESLKSVTVVIDTTAPTGSGGDPGDYLRGIANLTYAAASGDVSSVQFQFSPAGAGAWSNVGAADIAPPYEASWNTALVADGPYDLRAVVADTTGNVANTLLPGLPKTVDNSAPTGSVTAPVGSAYVSGAVAVDANASDGAVPPASGVSAVRFEVKPSGAGAYSVFGTQTAPVVGSTYRQTLATNALADGPAELRVVVTDFAGNESTSAASTVNVDNVAPVVTLDDPGAAVGASVALAASSSADTVDVTFRYRPVGDPGAGTAIGSDATAPFGITWSTPPAAEQQWELIAVATDGGGNVTTSAPRTVLVDRTQPTGSVTSPASGATVGGAAVALAATAADASGSGVVLVEWQVKEFGAGGFNTVASDTTAPYDAVWDSTSAPDGATEIRATVTDATGNVRTTAVVPVTVDSTGPSVTLDDPGAVLSGAVSLAATTGGGAARVAFSVSPANAGTWTPVADDTTTPFGAALDTAALADGLYDLRAIGFDGLGNPSTPSIREDVRLDNTAPQLLSAAPADGSVSASASQIVLTASEPVTTPGALLDGAAAPAPAISGNQLTFPTGALGDGLHVLSGELQDASGTRVPFRVAVTIESTVAADRPPVELSARRGGASTAVAPGSLASVTMPAAAWPSVSGPSDFMVLRVDLAPPAPVLGMPLLPGTQLVEVTARWALAGTPVTTFATPIEIVIPNPSGEPTLPTTSEDGTTWRALPLLQGASLPAGQQDGWYRDAAGVHILTRHLTWYALARDGEAPTEPTDLAGVVAGDGLTLRWIPGTDRSGQIGNVLLFVNGEGYREFGPTEFEAKLGAFAAGDTRSFTLVQKDAAGNASRHTAPLRAVPSLTGMTLDEAATALGAAGFSVGAVSETAAATAPPGTVVEPAGIRLALASTPIDLVVVRGAAAPQTRLAFSVAGSKRIELKKNTTIAVRINVTKPAQVTVTLRDTQKRRLYGWKLRVKAGANVVKLRLPRQIRKPGSYSLTWVARSGSETISRTVPITLAGPALAQVKPKRDEIEIVLAGDTPPGEALEPGAAGMPRRISSASGADQTFLLVSSVRHDVGVVVVDADAYGARFIADLRTVFPEVGVIAISREPARRMQSVRAGAVLALPRSTTATRLAKAIAAVAAA